MCKGTLPIHIKVHRKVLFEWKRRGSAAVHVFCARLQPLGGLMKNLPASADTRGHKSEFHFEWTQQFWAVFIKWNWVIKKTQKSQRVWECKHLLFSCLLFGFHLHVFTSEFASGEVSWFALCLYLSAIDYPTVRWFRWPVNHLGSVCEHGRFLPKVRRSHSPLSLISLSSELTSCL